MSVRKKEVCLVECEEEQFCDSTRVFLGCFAHSRDPPRCRDDEFAKSCDGRRRRVRRVVGAVVRGDG